MAASGISISATATPPQHRPLPRPGIVVRLARPMFWQVMLAIEVILIFGVWETFSNTGIWRRDFLPAPSDILGSLVDSFTSGAIWPHLAYSGQNFIVGYLLAAIAGVILGFFLGIYRLGAKLSAPFLWTLYATPRVAVAPLFVLWFGFGWESKVALIFLSAFFPILVNVMVGVENVDPHLVRAIRVFGASRMDVFRKVIVPNSLPYTLVGLKLGVGRGMFGLITSEFIGSSMGMGFVIDRAAEDFDLARAFAAVTVLLAMASLSTSILDRALHHFAPWYREASA